MKASDTEIWVAAQNEKAAKWARLRDAAGVAACARAIARDTAVASQDAAVNRASAADWEASAAAARSSSRADFDADDAEAAAFAEWMAASAAARATARAEQSEHPDPIGDAQGRLIAEQSAQPYKGRMRIDPVTGDVGIGTPSPQPAQRKPTTEQERQAFEAWANKPDFVHWNGDSYVCEDDYVNSYRAEGIRAGWRAWQARAAHGIKENT